MQIRRPPPTERRPPAAWVVLLFSLALIAGSAAQIAYRATLPTEGWTYTSGDDFDATSIIFDRNVLGAPSPLEPGDELISIAGAEVAPRLRGANLSEAWQVGQTMMSPGLTTTLPQAMGKLISPGPRCSGPIGVVQNTEKPTAERRWNPSSTGP